MILYIGKFKIKAKFNFLFDFLLFVLINFFLDYFALGDNNLMHLKHVIVVLLHFVERVGTVLAMVVIWRWLSTMLLFVDIADMRDDIVAVQEFLVANSAFVVSFAGMRLHMTTKFRFCVESKTANLCERNKKTYFMLKSVKFEFLPRIFQPGSLGDSTGAFLTHCWFRSLHRKWCTQNRVAAYERFQCVSLTEPVDYQKRF